MADQNTNGEPSKEAKEQRAFQRCMQIHKSNGLTQEEALAELKDHPGLPANQKAAAERAAAVSTPLVRPGAGTKTYQAPAPAKPPARGGRQNRQVQGTEAGESRGAKLVVQGQQEEAPAPTPGPAAAESDFNGGDEENWDENQPQTPSVQA